MDFDNRNKLAHVLSVSGAILSDLHLYQASKWSLEALNGLQSLTQEDQLVLFSSKDKPPNSYVPPSLAPDNFTAFKDAPKIQLASTYLHCKEFERAHFVLKHTSSQKATFLRLYALYLSGEKKCQFDANNSVKSQNPYLSTILSELDSSPLNDPFLLYLHGLISLKINNIPQCHESLYQSLSLYPFNWSCWCDLISSLSSFSDAKAIINRFHKNSKFFDNPCFNIMFQFFKISMYQEFFQTSNDMMLSLNYLLDIFPNFSFLKTQKALILYNALEYLAAEKIFDDILKYDPFRLDELDTYSNILYVMQKKSKLAFLAHYASEIDQMRPETCCIIANYYSVKFLHEKAIIYYKRAIALNSNCLSAWTLMGHEFVELKNSHAAIESYRRAVDTNNKDFRAWYGLGQAYEVMDMHLYSLYYYKRACSLRPLDKRMWQAIGNCCEKLKSFNDSIKAYKKALSVSNNVDSNILFKLGSIYSLIGDATSASQYMIQCLDQESIDGLSVDTVKARLWLSKDALKSNLFQIAYDYAIELTQGTSQEIEEARAIAREARMNLNTLASSTSTSTP